MTKSKAQLRAEAVDRLRDTDAWLSTSADLINAMLGDRCEVGMANKRRYFIDLLTDDEPPEGDAVSELRLWAEIDQSHEDPEHVLVERRIMSELADMVERDYVRRDLLTDEEQETDVSESIQNGEKDKSDTREKLEAADRVLSLLTGKERVFADDESHDEERDTREKLEADILAWRGKPASIVDMIPVWLDRQAAITRMEDECICHDCTIEQVEALQAKVDELEAENARLRSRMSDDSEYGRLVMGAYRELRAKLDEIANVVDA